MDTGKELATTDGTLELTGLRMGDIHSLAEAFQESGLFPDIEKKAQAIVKVVAGQELSLPPVYSMQNFYIIKGKLSMAAEVMGLLLKRSGQYDYDVIAHSDQACQIQFKQKVGQEWKNTYSSTFTIEDAKRAGLVRAGGNWTTFPKAMLFSRAMSQGARIVAPHLLGGARTIEEAESITPDALADVEPAPEPTKRKGKGKTKKADEVATPTVATEQVGEAVTKADGVDEAAADVDGIFIEKAPESNAAEEAPAQVAPSLTTFTFKRDPEAIKELSEAFKALHEDYGKQPGEVLRDLGVKRNMDITIRPSEVYVTVATIEESKKQAPA